MTSTSIKKVLLGSAAGILATATAQAADLPVKKAAAVQYVKVCPAYGPGFFEMPGTDMCIKFYQPTQQLEFYTSVPKDFLVVSQGKTGSYAQTYFNKSAADYVGFGASTRAGFDVRSPTEYGTLRTVTVFRMDLKGGNAAGLPPAGDSSVSPSCYRCFIEWAGFTFASNGASAWPYINEEDLIGNMIDSKITITLVQYSWKAPGGWSGSIGFEDPNKHFAKGAYGTKEAGLNLGAACAFGVVGDGTCAAVVTHGPTRWWDLIGVVSLQQDWGDISLRGALHQISMIATKPSALVGACPPPSVNCTPTGPVNVTAGWAAQLGFTFKLPMLGPKDKLMLQGVYADGATDYTGFNQAQITGQSDEGNTAGGLMRDDHDGIAINNGDGTFRIEKETSWSVTALLQHYWAPRLRQNFYANYAAVTPGTVTQNTDWMAGGLGKANKTTLATNLIWGEKVKTVEMGVEVMYIKANQDLAHNPGVAPTPLPGGLSANNDNWIFRTTYSRAW